MTPKSDLRWYFDLTQLCRDIMRDYSIRLLQEAGQRLRRPGPHKVGQGLDVLWLGGIQLGCEAPWKNAQNNHLGNTAQRFSRHLPPFGHGLEERVCLRPRTVQGQ